METNVPNLDLMDEDELRAFIRSQCIWPVNFARHLFPGRTAGHVKATRELYHYAWNKLTAIGCRKDGKIQTAIEFEDICDRIYSRLPAWARW